VSLLAHLRFLDAIVLAIPSDIAHGNDHIPLLKHSILTWFPAFGAVSARIVGEKNMASSSGWAMRRQMRLPFRLGKELRVIWAV